MMPAKEQNMTPKQPPRLAGVVPDATSYDEERVPFADVMRMLAHTKPPHKAAKLAPKPKKG